MADPVEDVHEPLRRDVRLLGQILGDVIREHASGEIYDAVEKVRTLAKQSRDGDAAATRNLEQFLRNLPVDDAIPVARAFAYFLTLANIAEQHHRVRRRRDHQRDPSGTPQRGSIQDALQRIIAHGETPERIAEVAGQLRIELVFTAHPTEITRRTQLAKHQRVAAALDRLDAPQLTPGERADTHEKLRREISALWLTPNVRRQRPTPEDEARAGFAVIEHTLWDALPTHLRELDRTLYECAGRGLELEASPIRFASWMGGDRDGNPNVTPDSTRRVVWLARWMAADLFLRDVQRLRDELSMATCSPSLRKLVKAAAEPYRAFLRSVREKLDGTRKRAQAELEGQRPPEVPYYADSAQLRRDLNLCYDSLHETGAHLIAQGILTDTLRRVAAFGLELLPLDLRQESARHTQAWDVITQNLGAGTYSQWDEEQRIRFLEQYPTSKGLPQTKDAGAPVTDVLDTLRVAASLPRESLGAYVISMTHAASDIIAVHVLQRAAGVDPPLPVVPLFETLSDLQRAPGIMRRLLDCQTYRGGLRLQGQQVMLGYSDSAKDAGLFAAHWALYEAQVELVSLFRKADVPLTIFHGRGGTVGRGGGGAHAAVLSLPPGAVEGRLRVTEQGEIIHARFGLAGIALRTLELYTSSVLEATLMPPRAPDPAWRSTVETMAQASARGYRDVVQGQPRLPEYFEAATPANELGQLNIGSRPARRQKAPTLENLRAIPWVFGWTQNRMILPGWLGVGDALAAARDSGSWGRVEQMRSQWPFFAATLDMVEMVLAKVDWAVADRYNNALVPSDLQSIGRDLKTRYESTVQLVLKALGHQTLLEGNPVLRRSISVRNPYVDPLNVLQVEYLRRLAETEDPRLNEALLITINGVAHGMRNTG